MHEYSIVASLVERVATEVEQRPGARVRKVHVCIGELAGVEIELLTTAYETFRAGSVCAEADLAVRREPARWACPRCARTLEVGARLSCPDCAVPARLAAGDEILLERIELEVPDV